MWPPCLKNLKSNQIKSNQIYIISTNELLNTTFIDVLNKLKYGIPSFIIIKKGSHILFAKDDAGNFFAAIDIGGLMNPSIDF